VIQIHLINSIRVDGESRLYYDNADGINFVQSGLWIEEIDKSTNKINRTFIPYTNIKFYMEKTDLTSYKE
jgi:hypothetical protein